MERGAWTGHARDSRSRNTTCLGSNAMSCGRILLAKLTLHGRVGIGARLSRLQLRLQPRHSPVPTALKVIALIAIASACTSAERDQVVVIRDSLGVLIVENGETKTLPEAFYISPVAMRDLGGDRGNPEHELDPTGPFHSAVRTSDGRFVVVSNHDLKLYAPDGQYLRSIGRQGQGPGEFGQVRSVCVTAGDTIIAIHYSAPRVSVFDPQGEHVRTFAVDAGYVEGSDCFDDGSVLIHTNVRANPESTLAPESAAVLDLETALRRVASDGTDLGALGDFPGGTHNLYFQTIANTVPYGEALYVGDGRAPELFVYANDGTLTRIIRWSEAGTPVTPEMVDEQIRGTIPSNTPASEVQERLARGRRRPHPATVPVYFQIMVDDARRIWVQDHPANAEVPWPWTVFDPDGRALGRVYLPEIEGARGTDIRSVGRDTVLLAWRDTVAGFPHLTFHALEQAPSTRTNVTR